MKCPMCHMLEWAAADPEAAIWAGFSVGLAPGADILFPFALCNKHAESGLAAATRCEKHMKEMIATVRGESGIEGTPPTPPPAPNSKAN